MASLIPSLTSNTDNMSSLLPSDNQEILRSIVGSKITSVKRQVFRDDMDLEDFEQRADGPVEFQLENERILHFVALTTENSVGVAEGKMPCYGESYTLLDVSNSAFWKWRIGQIVTRIEILKSKHFSSENPSEFGIDLRFGNGLRACIEFLDEEDFPDTLRIVSDIQGSGYLRKPVGTGPGFCVQPA